MSRTVFPKFSSSIFIVLSLQYILNWFLYMERDGGLVSFFCVWLSNFPRTIYWRQCLVFSVSFCWLCWRSVVCKYLALFLGILFCYIGLCAYFYTTTMLFWWLWPHSIVWSQVMWCLHFRSFCLVFLWLYGLSFGSMCIFGFFF